jgi:uncharacterized membrane protein
MSKAQRSKSHRPVAPVASAKPKRPRAPDWPIFALAGLGMLITAYLGFLALFGATPAFCTEASGCGLVQGSRWSVLMGLPVALWGFGLYALIALLSFFMPAQVKRWQWQLWLALIGLAVSIYLTVLGIVALDAVCAWCMASLLAIAAIVLTLALRRPATAPGMPLSRFAVQNGFAVVAVLGFLLLVHSGLVQAPEDPRLTALAEHLESSGAKYYGAFWCVNCQEQRRLFGASAEHLPYVECSPDGRRGNVAFSCVSNEITAYPTWIIRNKRYQEVLSPEMLARYSGFNWEARAPK